MCTCWGVWTFPEGVPAGGGCTCPGVYLLRGGPGQGGIPAQRGCTHLGGICRGGCTCLGVYLPRGVGVVVVVMVVVGCCGGGGVYLPRYSPLWTEFLTHATENISLPQTSFAGGKKLTILKYFTLVLYSIFCKQCKNYFVKDMLK